jgi:transposase
MTVAARWPARNDPANSQLFRLCMAVHNRNNWLFAGSLRAGQRAATIMSLIQSAKLNGHDPYQYLKDVLERIPTQPASRLDELLPHRWQPTPPSMARHSG